jgi:hypothetical protein
MDTAPARPTLATPVTVPLGEIVAIAAEYERAGRLDEAERLLGHVLAAAPNQGDALHQAGVVAFRKKRYADALGLMQRAIRYGVDTPLYLRNICEVYRTLGRLDEALDAARRAVALAPADPLCLHNLAIIHYHRLEIDDCIACARRALAIDPSLPGAHFELAEALLLRGEMASGWEEYEWRYRIAGAAPLMPATGKPQWDGGALPDATLLLVADQGFGDAIQFSRYIPWAAERCPAIAIACSAELAPLLRQIAPAMRLFQRWDDCPAYAAFCPLSGLPRLHATRLDNIPAPVPYLRADPASVAVWRERLAGLVPAGYRRIGIVWAGRPTHNNDRNRSATLSAFAPIAALPGIALVCLQKPPAADQAGRYFGRAPLVNIGAEIGGYDDTMGLLENLDLLVTVDTSVGHLAGAMGRPTWIMLPRAPDWRWLLDRSDSPWYPSVRLFRQRSAGQWNDVTTDIAEAISDA